MAEKKVFTLKESYKDYTGISVAGPDGERIDLLARAGDNGRIETSDEYLINVLQHHDAFTAKSAASESGDKPKSSTAAKAKGE
jgi:hypothetical protein